MKSTLKIAVMAILLSLWFAPTTRKVEAQAKICIDGKCSGGTKTVKIVRAPGSTKSSSKEVATSGPVGTNTKVGKGSKKGIRSNRYTAQQKEILRREAAKVEPGVHGGTASQIKQNHVAAKFNMESLVDESGRGLFIQKYNLTRVTSNNILEVRLDRKAKRDENYMFGFAAQFFYDMGAITKQAYGKRVALTSMWRSEAGQRARGQAKTSGICASTHPLAATADLGKNSNSEQVKAFLKRIAPRLEAFRTPSGRGVVEILKESTCFHIMVFPQYDLTTRAAIQAIMREEAGLTGSSKKYR